MERPPYHAFVIRFWWEEAGQDERPALRGWAQHVTTTETRYFQQVDELLDFLENWTGELERGERPQGASE